MNKMEKETSLVLVCLTSALLMGLISGCGSFCGVSAETCQPEMVETIPEGMRSATFDTKLRDTSKVLIEMIERAKSSIKITSMYFSLTDKKRKEHPSTEAGRRLLESLVEANKRGVKLEIVVDDSRKGMSKKDDLEVLDGIAKMYRLNMTRALGNGIMHAKFMITDDETLYLGSSNFDWRSYSHVKEIGVYFEGCPTMATDLDKVFQTYKLMASADKIPDSLPAELKTSINLETPFNVSVNEQTYRMYMAGAPPKVFNHETVGRTEDLEALLTVIDSAREYVNVSVMNYNIRTAYSWPKQYWPVIDNALRRAAIERRVRVNLLFSDWKSTKDEEIIWYKSLNAIQSDPTAKWSPLGKGRIHVKLFKVPAYDEFQSKVPFARVKHDKYVVTDNSLYVGTSNWTPEYFQNTCGVGFVFKRTAWPASGQSIIEDMKAVFERDFESEFARDL